MNNCLVKYEKAWEGFLDGIIAVEDNCKLSSDTKAEDVTKFLP